MKKTLTSAALLTALLTALGLTLAACGGTGDDTASGDQPYNEADVTFASDMIQHHAQALTMVDMTASHELDPQVQALAEDIRAAQAPEIETMADWLQDWDKPLPETVRDHANAHHSGHDADTGDTGDTGGMGGTGGMMSQEQMRELQDASHDQFQDMWLQMMIEHHEGAIEMAQLEQETGKFGPATELAGDIITTQQAEIDTMQDLLG